MRRRFTIHKDFTKPINIDNYLTIEASEDGLTASLSVNACEYCVDGDGNWKTLSAETATESINSGHTLSFRGNLTPNDTNGIGTFTINKKCNLKGNCMSMLFGDNAADNYSLSGKNYAFYKLFYNCKNIVNVSSNFLPATTLTNYCYWNMFYGCTSLKTAPELPATTLTEVCYNSMFSGCKSLTTAPVLPATSLTDYCYGGMFYGCTSLTTVPSNLLPAITLTSSCYQNMFRNCSSLTVAPELPATTLVDSCYQGMFDGCTKLNYIKCLATDISANTCTSYWVSGVASTGTFVKAADMTGWTTGSSGIPNGWTVENYIDYNKEPLTFNILSAGTINWTASTTRFTKTIKYKLNNGGWTSITSNTSSSAPKINVVEGDKIQFKGNNTQYATGTSVYNSFSGSTALFEAEGNIMSLIYGDNFKNNLAISRTYAFFGLFRGCTKLVSAENLVLPATTLADSCYRNMFQECSSLTTAPALPATTLANSCYLGMFFSCTSLTTAPLILPADTLAEGCYWSMFNKCSSLTTAPALPATTLAKSCYRYMFQDCTLLTTAPTLPATTLADSCYQYMFYGCTSLNYIKCLATNISASNCTGSWVGGVASTGTFVKASSMTSWSTDSSSGIPTGWTVQNA